MTDTEQQLIDFYFKIYKQQLEEKKAPIALLMQCGGFYEMYVYHNEETDEWYGSNLYELKDVLRCNRITAKGTKTNERGDLPKMWGFPEAAFDTYCNILSDEDLIVIKMNQIKDKSGRVIDRVITEQVTPGTYVSRQDDLLNTESNNISCLYFKKYYDNGEKIDRINYGYSNINSYTGETYIYEGTTETMYMDSTILNELDRYLINNNPNEMLIVSNLDDKEQNKVNNCLGICDCLIRSYNLNDAEVKKILKISNIDNVITKTFGSNSSFFAELEWYNLGTTSLVFLIEYINKYNPLVVKKLSLPNNINNNNKVLLENHTLQQLNIVDDFKSNSKRKNKKSSLINLLNNCYTMSGKRLFREVLVNPTMDIDNLNREYKIIEDILKKDNIFDITKPYLKKVKDLNYTLRKITVEKGCPNDIYKIYISLYQLKCILDNKEVLNVIEWYLNKRYGSITEKKESLEGFLNGINNMVQIDNCAITTITVEDLHIIKEGYDKDYDLIKKEYLDQEYLLKSVIDEINYFIGKTAGRQDSFVKEYNKPKTPSEIRTTQAKKKLFENAMNFVKPNTEADYLYVGNLQFTKLSSIKFKKSTSSNYSIVNDDLERLVINLNNSREKLLEETKIVFSNILKCVFEKYFDEIHLLSNIIGNIDLIICKAYNSKIYNYCKPTIIKDDNSYFDVKDLRHPLIEHINENEKYVTNDLSLGKEKNGLLLFGTNAVGKTSSIRAIGMIIIMAQAGMYVPASQLIYSPYSKIYSRILGNDNLFKNMSTYQVELSELRPIIHYSDKNSLVLGDELCSGTEHPSALSVNAAGIISLNNLGPTYIFATHYHDLVDWKEIQNLDRLSIKHMSVIYNKERQELIYERKFRDGEGDRSYGLEVLKSAHFKEEFVKECYDLYNKYFKNMDHRVSRYNSNLIKPAMCELCGNEPAVDTHHILEQKEADANGFIEFQHKNHKSNLIWLCKNCHLKQTDENDNKIIKKVKTTNGYKLQLNNGRII